MCLDRVSCTIAWDESFCCRTCNSTKEALFCLTHLPYSCAHWQCHQVVQRIAIVVDAVIFCRIAVLILDSWVVAQARYEQSIGDELVQYCSSERVPDPIV